MDDKKYQRCVRNIRIATAFAVVTAVLQVVQLINLIVG
jgi:hypothetical protein